MFALEGNTATQAVVGSIIWAFCGFKTQGVLKRAPNGYALHSVSSNFPIFFSERTRGRSLVFRDAVRAPSLSARQAPATNIESTVILKSAQAVIENPRQPPQPLSAVASERAAA